MTRGGTFLLMFLLAALPLSAARAQSAPCGAGVSPGTQKAYVRTVQTELNLRGYDAGPPDGVASAKTEEAVRDYQRAAKLPVDGCVTKSLVDNLHFVLPKVEKPLLSRARPVVIEAQKLLTRRGYYLGAVDGLAGPKTRAAARRFQAAAGLPATGAVDQTLVENLKTADSAIRGDAAAAKP